MGGIWNNEKFLKLNFKDEICKLILSVLEVEITRLLDPHDWPVSHDGYGGFRCTTVWGYAVFLKFFVDLLLVFKWSQEQINFFQEEFILLHDYGNSWITEERNFS